MPEILKLDNCGDFIVKDAKSYGGKKEVYCVYKSKCSYYKLLKYVEENKLFDVDRLARDPRSPVGLIDLPVGYKYGIWFGGYGGIRDQKFKTPQELVLYVQLANY